MYELEDGDVVSRVLVLPDNRAEVTYWYGGRELFRYVTEVD